MNMLTVQKGNRISISADIVTAGDPTTRSRSTDIPAASTAPQANPSLPNQEKATARVGLGATVAPTEKVT